MKNISLITNIVLAVALGVLFFLHFSLRGKVNEMNQPVALSSGAGTVVYVNMDSLYNQYDEYVDMKNSMEDKQRKMSAELNSKKSSYERSVMDFQDKVQKGLLLRSEAEKIQQQLVGEEQNLMKINESMQAQLSEETTVLNRRLYNNIVEFLKDYNKNGRYTYVMSHAYGGSLLYVNDSLDITRGVIKGLNEKYRSTEKGK